jgi:hypothetical protein
MKLSDDGSLVILASGHCPFCLAPIHIVCDRDKLNESAKIVNGRVVSVLCRTFAHPDPMCSRFTETTRRSKTWKWLWRKGDIRIDPTPLSEALS